MMATSTKTTGSQSNQRVSIKPCGKWPAGSGDRTGASNLERSQAYAMTGDRPTRDTMSLEEATICNMWEIAALVEVLGRKG